MHRAIVGLGTSPSGCVRSACVVGKMADEVVKDVLQENYDILCEYLDASSLVNKMFAKRLLTDYEKMEILEGSSTKLARNEKLIDSLMRRGPNGFNCFCDILESSTNPSSVALGRGLRQGESSAERILAIVRGRGQKKEY